MHRITQIYVHFQSVVTKEDGITHQTKLEFVTYGTKNHYGDRSGAYLFLPDGDARVNIQRSGFQSVFSGLNWF